MWLGVWLGVWLATDAVRFTEGSRPVAKLPVAILSISSPAIELALRVVAGPPLNTAAVLPPKDPPLRTPRYIPRGQLIGAASQHIHLLLQLASGLALALSELLVTSRAPPADIGFDSIDAAARKGRQRGGRRESGGA